MTIKFKNFEEKKRLYADSVLNNESKETQSKAFDDMMSTMVDEIRDDILSNVNTNNMDNVILSNRGQQVLTSEELKFFNAVIEQGGFKEHDILPKTTQERVFDDLVKEHPLLAKLGLENYGAITEFIYGNPEGAAVWGELFGGIQGNLNANFRKEKIGQYKLTAFFAVSNDMLSLGPVWVEKYVRTFLVEALKVALEKAFILGDGKSQPIGLNRDLLAAVTQGQYAEKASAGTLTFKDTKTIIAEIAGVHKNLAKYKRLKKDGVTEENEFQARNIAGKVVMLINPFEYYDIMARATVQNASGTFITALPFNPTIIESIFVPTGKVIFFVEGEYLAITAGSFGISQFKETLAMEDATLYITKMYANGKPKDNYAAQVYNLNITPLA
jgi:phage capsid family|nr:MAG TPA: major capsid protein [Caudoviricetes sp.]